jgi:hypothetical protein
MATNQHTSIRATNRPAAERLSAGRSDPYRRLAAGILVQAAKDAKAGDTGAALWLLSEQAEFLAGAVGLSWVHVKRWAADLLRVV